MTAGHRLLLRLNQSAGAVLWRVSLGLGVAAVGCLAAMLVDARVLDNGHNVWLKPLRFCIAFSVHLMTVWWLAQMTRRVESGDVWFGLSALLQAVTAVVEWLCIALQAARGVHSHFNYTTPFDSAIFTVMGLGTAVLLLGIVLMMVGLVRKPADTVPTTAVLIGLALAVVGGLVGVWMVMPTPEQRAVLQTGLRLPWVGSAWSAAPSGLQLAFFGWDLRSGDWRVPHFMALHGLQAIPLLAWLHVRTGGNPSQRPPHLWLGTLAYVAAVACAIVSTAFARSALDVGSWQGSAVMLALLVFVGSAVAIPYRLIRT